MQDDEALFWYLFAATKGGPNRLRIVCRLLRGPQNANQLAKSLQLDYKTIQHHLDVLVENTFVLAQTPKTDFRHKKAYGELYSASPFTKSKKKLLDAIWHKIKNAEKDR